MSANKFYLFKGRRFSPLFITQFLGCFNDNILKSAIIILITYKEMSLAGLSPQIMMTIASGVFILPFVLFAGISGQIADKYEKSTLIQIIKLFEIFIIIIAINGFYEHNLFKLLISLLLMGVHSNFFGPIKYSIIPEHVAKNELLAANGFIEAGTFLGILLGGLFGGIYNSDNFSVIMGLMIISSIAGFIASLFIPKTNNFDSNIEINHNFIAENTNIIKYAFKKKQIFLSILGISWFWFIGSTFLSQIPNLSQDILGADQTVVTLFMSVFSIGVCVGSILSNKLLGNEITTKYIFLASIGISIFGIDLFFGTRIAAIDQEQIMLLKENSQLINATQFLTRLTDIRIVLVLFCLAVISGFYIVPLYAVLQHLSAPAYRSRVIAANNIVNSIFMIISTIYVIILLYANIPVHYIILSICILNVGVAVYIYKLVPNAKIIPEPLLRFLFKFLFNKLYRVKVKGLENFYKAGKRTVIIANHISFLDAALLAIYLPEKFVFAIYSGVAQSWWVKPFLKIVKTYQVEPSNAMAAKSLISELKRNNKIAIFPEGRLSVTGSLMKIYEGPGMIADKAGASILPVRIDGPQYTHFSKLRKFAKTRIFPQITITILPPVKLDAPEHYDNRARRKYIGHKLYDIMSEMIFESSDYRSTIFQSLINAAKVYGFKTTIIRDFDNNHLNYRQILAKSFILGNYIAKVTDPGEFIGVLLPNATGSVVTYFATQCFGRTPAMLNFTAGASNVISACKTGNIKIVYTSRNFIERAELHDLVEKLQYEVKLIYLEDIKTQISLKNKLIGMFASFIPQIYYNNICLAHNDESPATILFTSGTEGAPKAVVLSHRNIQANRCQVAARIDFGTHDLAFNALPMFHSFGLNAGTLLPILSGIQTFLYPSPLHYRVVPEIIYDIGATIMFGTDTFLSGYAKFAHPYDFYSLRYVFAGAEKLRFETRKLWFDKYGVRIFEGYGATEASPVISINTPMHDKPGTVGRLLPSVEYFIKPTEGINEGGKLCVKGPNIMLGYMFNDAPGVIREPKIENMGPGWYDTGDVVTIDDEGFMTIRGRVKRFAKIAGEMVSLLVVEEFVTSYFPDDIHAAIHIADDKKGEQIILFSTNKTLSRASLVEHLKDRGLSEIFLPKYIINVEQIPVLSTGKTNYRQLLSMAEEGLLK